MEIDPILSVPDGPPKPASASSSTKPAVVPSPTARLATPSTDATKAASELTTPAVVKPPGPSDAPPLPSSGKANPLLEEANEELALLLTSGKVTQREITALQSILHENVALKEKIAKLKSLLGRSAKAQKEAKTELDLARRQLDESGREVERLNRRVEALASRPTHMDLLADFETNFDRALLSVGTTQQQSGGEDPSGKGDSSGTPTGVGAAQAAGTAGGLKLDDGDDEQGEVVSAMLLTELSAAKSRLEHLESLNTALLHRASKLEKTNEALQDERDSAMSKVTNLQLELRMAKMETENASRAARERAASLAEMQLEIDLVTKASMDANARAAEGMEAARTVKTDKKYVEELEMKVQALQEWALASAEAKSLTVERVRELENRVKELEDPDGLYGEDGGGSALSGAGGRGVLGNVEDHGAERRLWTKNSSLVVGAGMVQYHVVELGDCAIAPNETVLLRWKFDVTPSDLDVEFSILKGRCETSKKQAGADTLIKDRLVKGGGGGEVGAAFAVQNSCTLLWSNVKSWVRPRTIKFTVEAYAVMD